MRSRYDPPAALIVRGRRGAPGQLPIILGEIGSPGRQVLEASPPRPRWTPSAKYLNRPPRANAKTTPSIEWPHRACDWAGLRPEQSILTGAAAITSLGVVLADSGLKSLLFSSRPPR